jgi:hypothetical protein
MWHCKLGDGNGEQLARNRTADVAALFEVNLSTTSTEQLYFEMIRRILHKSKF